MTTSSTVEAAAPADAEIRCPACGLELQATVLVWLSVSSDGVIVPSIPGDAVSDDMTWYCANSHDTSEVALQMGLDNKAREYLEARIT